MLNTVHLFNVEQVWSKDVVRGIVNTDSTTVLVSLFLLSSPDC